MLCSSCMLKSILVLFIALDALGNAPLFYSFTLGISEKLRRRVIVRSAWVALLILATFSLIGDVFLGYFGLSLADFRIAGGIILLVYGVKGILGHIEAESIRDQVEAESLAVVPLATPLLAGPAAIATVLYIKAVYGLSYAMVSVVVNIVVTYVLLGNSEKLMNMLGRNGAIALSKIMAILLAAIAVSMIRTGVVEIAVALS